MNLPSNHYPDCAELIRMQLKEFGLEVQLIKVPEAFLKSLFSE